MIDPLTQIAFKYHTDKYEPLGYTPHYHTHFEPIRHDALTLVEIGVASGGSIEMWGEYFPDWYTQIIGIDIDPECYYTPEDTRLDIRIADGTRDDAGVGTADIVIDDGSHTSDDILRAFNFWWPKVASGGWYVIEDWKVQWWIDYGGHPVNGSNASKTVLGLIESLMRHDDKVDVSGVHVYDQLVFLRKK